LLPSSPGTITAFTWATSFAIGSASEAPESIHDVSGLNRNICLFVELPPTKAAWVADHGRRIGSIVGGAADWYETTVYGADAPIVKVCVEGIFVPS
jgi:hypothetical protein